MSTDAGPRAAGPLVAVSGAVLADAPDATIPWHFGDPYAEQRALEGSAGLVDRSNRGVVTVTGPDRLSWLHSLTSQHLADLAPWTPVEALILDPHGHVEHHLQVLDDGDTTVLTVEPGTSEALVSWLTRMKFLLRVEVAVEPTAVLTVLGPSTQATLQSALGAGLPGPAGALAVDIDAARVLVVRRPWPAIGVDLLVPDTIAGAVAARLLDAGAVPSGLWAYDALRVAARKPRLGFETDHKTIPHEIGWLESAVHLNKGCYRGQETVARVHNLGRPPRRLVLLQLDGSGSLLPERGSDVLMSDPPGTRVGFVTTAVRHYEQGPLALALVKRTVPDDAPLTADGIPAAIDPED